MNQNPISLDKQDFKDGPIYFYEPCNFVLQ